MRIRRATIIGATKYFSRNFHYSYRKGLEVKVKLVTFWLIGCFITATELLIELAKLFFPLSIHSVRINNVGQTEHHIYIYIICVSASIL